MLYADFMRRKMKHTQSDYDLTNWYDIQKIVRSGEATRYFKVRDQLTVYNSYLNKDVVFDIIGIDHDIPADSRYTHSMTLQLHDAWDTMLSSDSYEAAWYIDEKEYPDGIQPGTYQFTTVDGNTYNFTLTQAVPVGGQIVCYSNYTRVFIYKTKDDIYTIDNLAISSGAVGEVLPTPEINVITSTTNSHYRTVYGSNNWAESNIRQWLNTDKDKITWWKAQTKFDRPPSYQTMDGFLKGFDSAFLDAVGEVVKTTQRCATDGYGLETSKERFFLLSRPEIYGGVERNEDGADGKVYPYYDTEYSDLISPGIAHDKNRIKYRNGGAVYWRLRTPVADSDCKVCAVSHIGTIARSYEIHHAWGVVPACAIV